MEGNWADKFCFSSELFWSVVSLWKSKILNKHACLQLAVSLHDSEWCHPFSKIFLTSLFIFLCLTCSFFLRLMTLVFHFPNKVSSLILASGSDFQVTRLSSPAPFSSILISVNDNFQLLSPSHPFFMPHPSNQQSFWYYFRNISRIPHTYLLHSCFPGPRHH